METIHVEAKQVQTVSSQTEVNETTARDVAVVDGVAFWIPLCFLLVWAIAIFMVTGFPKAVREREFSLKSPPKMPCRGCRFFNNNPYLRCALHPSDALTTKAIDCRDYSPREEHKP